MRGMPGEGGSWAQAAAGWVAAWLPDWLQAGVGWRSLASAAAGLLLSQDLKGRERCCAYKVACHHGGGAKPWRVRTLYLVNGGCPIPAGGWRWFTESMGKPSTKGWAKHANCIKHGWLAG